MKEKIRIFTPDARGPLVSRPNRFIVHVRLPEGEVRAHCPNPGRLIELMNPGRTMILQKNKPGGKTDWTLAAAEYNGETVSMYSAKANTIAGELVIPRLFPEARDIKAEYKWGRSRFDWHFYEGDREIFLEVKACTLIEEGTAMFPDAPSVRASRHLEELAELADPAVKREAHVVFVIMNPGTRRFIPCLHTDPDFALTLHNTKNSISFHGVSVACDEEGMVGLSSLDVPVVDAGIDAVKSDSGVYMILIHMEEEADVEIGALGLRHFQAGWYIYAGSAKKNLKARVKRHLAKRKTKRWHADYLIAVAGKTKGFPIYTLNDLECRMAGDLEKIAHRKEEGFGCSDCDCPSHLFYFADNPLQNRDFLNLLFHYRHTLAFA